MSMQSITTWTFKPHEPIELARRFADREGTTLLFSGGDLDSAISSYLCLFPEEKLSLRARENCWEELQRKLGEFDPTLAPIPRWVGYLGYEMGCFADPDKKTPYLASSIPDCCFYRPTVVIHFDHRLQKATLYAKEKNISLKRASSVTTQESLLKLGYFSDSYESYQRKIAQIKEWILEGDVYQVNLSQEFHIEGESSPFQHFERIVHLNPAPFTAYVNCHNFSIVSSSPERFISKRHTKLETRPIKGTAPRGRTEKEDHKNRQDLLNSEKEKAELLMITDLMRNDLGKISLPGSVNTREIWRCEAYANVFHLLSVIEGRCRQEEHPIELLRQIFPGGSITGCPKLRAMEAIAALEGRPRGLYTGSIGYIANNGDFDFNIAIRTLIVHPQSIQIQLGGAIVIDSDPLKEYEETLHKGQSLFDILAMKELVI